MPASMQPVVNTTSAPVPADVSQANASDTGMDNGKPFADTLSQQIDKQQAKQSVTEKAKLEKTQTNAADNGNTNRQELASSSSESGKSLPPADVQKSAHDCECPADTLITNDDSDISDVLPGQLTQTPIEHGLQHAMLVGQMPKFEHAMENLSKHDNRSALLDLMQDIKSQGVEGFFAGGSGSVGGSEPMYNPLANILARNPHQAGELEQPQDPDFAQFMSEMPFNVMSLPKEMHQWLESDTESGGAMAALYTRYQKTTHIETHGVDMKQFRQDVLKAMQAEVGSDFELAGDFKGSTEVLNAQREVMNLQSLFGKSDKSVDGGFAGLFKLISMQKVASAISDVQMSDKLQFQQMMQNNLMTGLNQGLFKALSDDMGDSLPLLQASGALMNTHGNSQAQGASSLANILTSSSTVNQPLGQAGWDRAVGERLQWMVKKDIQQAELKMNPRHLGPIEVKISVSQDQITTVNFTAAHNVTRDALEAAIPRLREMMGENGMTQVDVNVSQHSFAQQQQQAQEEQGQGRHHASANGIEHANDSAAIDDDAGWHTVPITHGGARLLDIFA